MTKIKRIASIILLASVTASAQTVTTVGPTPTGQAGTETTVRQLGPTARQQAAASAASAGVMIVGAIGAEAGADALWREAIKHAGPDKDYKSAYKNCLRREIGKVGVMHVSGHGNDIKATCHDYAEQEFPSAPTTTEAVR